MKKERKGRNPVGDSDMPRISRTKTRRPKLKDRGVKGHVALSWGPEGKMLQVSLLTEISILLLLCKMKRCMPRWACEVPRLMSEVPRLMSEIPRLMSEVPRLMSEVPRLMSELFLLMSEVPRDRKSVG